MLKSCFIEGLKPELCHDVKLLRPLDVYKAQALALHIDAKLADSNIRSFSKAPNFSWHNSFGSKTAPTSQDSGTSTSSVHLPKQNNVKKMTFEEIRERRRKGLCDYCLVKWFKGHVCQSQQLLLLDLSDRSEEVLDVNHVLDEGEELSNAHITACAVYGVSAPDHIQTMKVLGSIKHCPAVILFYSGSSHNFIHSAFAKKMGWRIDPLQKFDVMIANGGTITSMGCCSQVKITIQDYEYISDLYVLQLGGCDVVLGAQWLRTLGPILWDFEKLKMEFTLGQRHYCLCSSPAPAPRSVTACHVQRLLTQGSFGVVLCLIAPDDAVAIKADLSHSQEAELDVLLSQFEAIFQLPTTLLPSRSYDHKIPLLGGSKPPSARPYLYNPMQKSEIEKCVMELLDSGFIRASNSHFSSPVLLVRKKDDIWRMCMDYQALNLLTIKDKYPFPLIDELLDELWGAQFFSKLDLRASYHQI